MNTPLDSSLLYHICDPKQFSFTTTEELEPLEQPIGQANALEAVEFGIEIQQDGYNLFAMGPSGSGKHSTVMAFLEKKIAE
ncbi:MAG: AAA family ATPase [Helicobacteraceae bacterium]|jgi:DNA replication protein DnaC|nr:AAA family ATPase [Helicobacteraceae bacterium]